MRFVTLVHQWQSDSHLAAASVESPTSKPIWIRRLHYLTAHIFQPARWICQSVPWKGSSHQAKTINACEISWKTCWAIGLRTADRQTDTRTDGQVVRISSTWPRILADCQRPFFTASRCASLIEKSSQSAVASFARNRGREKVLIKECSPVRLSVCLFYSMHIVVLYGPKSPIIMLSAPTGCIMCTHMYQGGYMWVHIIHHQFVITILGIFHDTGIWSFNKIEKKGE